MGDSEWLIHVSGEVLEELEQSFFNGPISTGEKHLLIEKQVALINGLKIEIFANEHPPPHFRIKYQGETANYRICDGKKINGGLDKWSRNIKKWHKNNKPRLIECWNEMRPDDCPVGEYREKES